MEAREWLQQERLRIDGRQGGERGGAHGVESVSGRMAVGDGEQGWGPYGQNSIPTPTMVLVLASPPSHPPRGHSLSSLACLPCCLGERQARFHQEVLWPPSAAFLTIRANLSTFRASFLSLQQLPQQESVPGSRGAWTESLEGCRFPRWPLSLHFPLCCGLEGQPPAGPNGIRISEAPSARFRWFWWCIVNCQTTGPGEGQGRHSLDL